MTSADSKQTTRAFMEIAICIARGLHERDPGATERMNFAAAKAYHRLKDRGDHAAAEILYQFGRALLDRNLFPEAELQEEWQS
jgi:hypothetical protein